MNAASNVGKAIAAFMITVFSGIFAYFFITGTFSTNNQPLDIILAVANSSGLTVYQLGAGVFICSFFAAFFIAIVVAIRG